MDNNKYIDISKASGSSLVEKAGASTAFNSFVPINKIAKIKGLKSNRSIRIAIQKGKYIAREKQVFRGTSYEILYSSLEPEIQEKLEDEELRCTALVPLNNNAGQTFISESAKLTALARTDVVTALFNIRSKYKTKKEADFVFLDLYNSGLLLPKVYNFLGSITIGTLYRWVKSFEEYSTNSLLPQYRFTK